MVTARTKREVGGFRRSGGEHEILAPVKEVATKRGSGPRGSIFIREEKDLLREKERGNYKFWGGKKELCS